MNECEKAEHLDRVILHSFDLTLSELIQKGRVISPETVKARNYLVLGQIPSK
jgi:HD superfamily phosphohydrolase YqeK